MLKDPHRLPCFTMDFARYFDGMMQVRRTWGLSSRYHTVEAWAHPTGRHKGWDPDGSVYRVDLQASGYQRYRVAIGGYRINLQ